MLLWGFYWNNAMNTSRHTTWSRCDCISGGMCTSCWLRSSLRSLGERSSPYHKSGRSWWAFIPRSKNCATKRMQVYGTMVRNSSGTIILTRFLVSLRRPTMFQKLWTKGCPYPTPRFPALRQMFAKIPTETVSYLGCTHHSPPIMKRPVDLTSKTTTLLYEYEHRI